MNVSTVLTDVSIISTELRIQWNLIKLNKLKKKIKWMQLNKTDECILMC